MSRPDGCICDYNPATTEGPDECCPHHGRPYGYWVERGDELQARLADRDARLAAVEALADDWERTGGPSRVAFLVAADELRTALRPNPSEAP